MTMAMMAVFSLAFVSCSEESDDNGKKGSGQKADVQITGDTGLKYEPLSDEEISKLQVQGYNIVGTPVSVTQDGNDHVLLSDMATVSFKIPGDVPKEQYRELVGVLITEDGPEYIIPDLDALNEGVVKFQTIHFCTALTAEAKAKLNDQFAEYVAIHGWDDDLRESSFNKLGDKLKEALDNVGLSENDLLGITMREVLGSNDYVNMTMEYINAYDNDNLSDKAISDISEKIEDDLKTKTLAVLLAKLKKDPNNKAVKECIEKYMTKDNAEKVGTLLGSESPAKVALEFAKDFAKDKVKGLITQNPYVKAFVVAAEVEVKAIDIFHKFWARNDMIYYYREFEKLQKETDNPDYNWSLIESMMRGAPKFEFSMTLAEMKEMFKKRYNDERKISAKKSEILKLIDMWDQEELLGTSGLLSIRDYFTNNGKQKDDYCKRLTRIHTLMERFRTELVIDGALWYDGSRIIGSDDINRHLSNIVWEYITTYPDTEAFYKWLEEEGYLGKKIEKDADKLDEIRSWWLVKTEHNTVPNESGGDGSYSNYYASDNELRFEGKCWGYAANYLDNELYDVALSATCETPPAWIEGGDTLLLHTTARRTSADALCYFPVGATLLWRGDNVKSTYADAVNVVGTTEVGTRPEWGTYGEWDSQLYIPRGSKGAKRYLIFQAFSGNAQVIWIYRWCGIFEKDEYME